MQAHLPTLIVSFFSSFFPTTYHSFTFHLHSISFQNIRLSHTMGLQEIIKTCHPPRLTSLNFLFSRPFFLYISTKKETWGLFGWWKPTLRQCQQSRLTFHHLSLSLCLSLCTCNDKILSTFLFIFHIVYWKKKKNTTFPLTGPLSASTWVKRGNVLVYSKIIDGTLVYIKNKDFGLCN